LPVAHLALLLLCFNLHRIDSLNTVGTLFHDAAAAHRDVGIPQAVEAGCCPIGKEQEIEAPHLVGTVIRAIPRAHAAVIDHLVQAFGTVHGCNHRTNQFTGRVLAMHTGHRFVVNLGVGHLTFVIGIHTDPVHLPAVIHLLFADHRDIVFSLAGYHAGIAAGAAAH